MSFPGAVGISGEALYFAAPTKGQHSNVDDYASAIHKFSLEGAPAYRGSGSVEGHVRHPFWMDERDGKLRVASSSGSASILERSTLSVLEEAAGALLSVGTTSEIARGETIRAGFDGGRAYVATSKKNDTLSMFDLSGAGAPQRIGDIKTAGDSVHVHPLEPAHLLTVGYDVQEAEADLYGRILVRLFDISNGAAPLLVNEEAIRTRGWSGERQPAAPLAFTYLAPGLLSLPTTICEGAGPRTGEGSTTFSGLLLFDAAIPNRLALRGKVAHPVVPEPPLFNSTACDNWWSAPTSPVRRSVVIDGFVFSISETRIKVNAIDAPDRDVHEVRIGE